MSVLRGLAILTGAVAAIPLFVLVNPWLVARDDVVVSGVDEPVQLVAADRQHDHGDL